MEAVIRPGFSKPAALLSEWLPVVIGLLVLYVPTFYGLATTLWQDEDHAHGPIVLAVIFWVFWQQRHALFETSPQPDVQSASLTGFAFLLFGLLTYALGRSQDIILLEVGSLVPVVAGVLLTTRGWPQVRACWFALFFIVFLVPLPSVLVDALTGPLKQNVSAVAEHLLYVAGYPVARIGVVLNVGNYQLLVADACSGLNSMFSLSAIGVLYLYLMAYKGRLHNAFILASILPIAFCANIVRVLILVLITYYFGDAAGQGFAHGFAGMLLFGVALLSLLSLDATWRVGARLLSRRSA